MSSKDDNPFLALFRHQDGCSLRRSLENRKNVNCFILMKGYPLQKKKNLNEYLYDIAILKFFFRFLLRTKPLDRTSSDIVVEKDWHQVKGKSKGK